MPQRHVTPAELDHEIARRRLKPEADVMHAIVTWLKVRGVFAWRQETTGVPIRDKLGRVHLAKSTRAGTPDILGFLPWGQGLAIEVKRPGLRCRVRPEQQQWIDEARKRAPGVLVMVVDTLAEVMAELGPRLHAWQQTMGAK